VINISDKKITFEKEVKFLPLYFEADLKRNHQVEAIRQKCIKPMAIINFIQTTWMRADPKILMRLYTALIRSHVVYRGFLFHSITKGQMDLLERIQHKAKRLSFGYTRSTPKRLF
jgi:hypothetical protein